ncbi:MAG: hypothetical protein IJN63_06575 [Clostridia bacterium]|nr:hypothetical protein [Clostridia bacterium]
MKDKYLSIMSKQKLSPEARERIEDKLGTERVARMGMRPLRVAAVALCIAMLLAAGTVTAAEMLKAPSLTDGTTGEDESSFKVKAEVELFELKNELAALVADAEKAKLRTSFASKAELEEYLGTKLVDCPVLDDAGIVEDLEESFKWGFDIYPPLEKDADARYVLSMYDGNGEECTDAPHVIKITYHRVVQNEEVYVEASIFTELYDTAKLEEGVITQTFGPESYIISNVYVDDEGNIQYDAKNFYDAKYKFTTAEYEMKNGNTAMIVTAEKDMGVDPGHKEYIAYFVQDGILYSVRPYAIYDPSKDFPNLNEDSLIPMYAILDSVK